MKRKRTAAVSGVVLAGVAGAGAVVMVNATSSDGERAPTGVPSASAPVVTTDVARRENVTGTLGRSGTHTVIAPGQGTVTWLPPVGTVIGRGGPAYEVDGRPVILFVGERPPWRAFTAGMTDGTDVQQLEDNLAALGYGAGVTVDRHFSSATSWAVRRWQEAVGLPVTGTVPLGQIVFVTGTMRVSGSEVRTGQSVGPGTVVQRGTGEQRAITAQVTTTVLASVRVGDPVVVILPGGATKTGTIASVGAVTQAPGTPGTNPQPSALIVVTVPGEVDGVVEDAQVQVGITVEARRGVLAVPVPALRAIGPAEYEVLVTDGGQTRHVPVDAGIFDQVTGLVEVSGEGLAAGQRVAVPPDTS